MLPIRFSSVATVLLGVGSLMAQGPVKQPDLKIVPRGLQVEVSCSPTKIRTPIARISWEGSEETLQGQRLDVTVYKDGFSRGVYASLSSVRPSERFVIPRAEKALAYRPPGLDLVVSNVETSRQTRRPAVVVEGLQPGLNYFWRIVAETKGLSVSSEVVRQQAPVCPADLREEPKSKSNSSN